VYLRHTPRVKDGKAHTYWRLVRSVRVGRKVVQQTVAPLGELDAEGRAQAQALARTITGGRGPPDGSADRRRVAATCTNASAP
jgi:broad specificity phosphatase PhoE